MMQESMTLKYVIRPHTMSLVASLHPRDLRHREGEFFIDNLLVRIQFIIVMIRWIRLAPWEFEFPVPAPCHWLPLAAPPSPASHTKCGTHGVLGSHMQTLIIYNLGFNQNYHTFTLILLINIVLCSKFP